MSDSQASAAPDPARHSEPVCDPWKFWATCAWTAACCRLDRGPAHRHRRHACLHRLSATRCRPRMSPSSRRTRSFFRWSPLSAGAGRDRCCRSRNPPCALPFCRLSRACSAEPHLSVDRSCLSRRLAAARRSVDLDDRPPDRSAVRHGCLSLGARFRHALAFCDRARRRRAADRGNRFPRLHVSRIGRVARRNCRRDSHSVGDLGGDACAIRDVFHRPDFYLGVVFGWLRWKSGSTWLTIVLHAIVNFTSLLQTVYFVEKMS